MKKYLLLLVILLVAIARPVAAASLDVVAPTAVQTEVAMPAVTAFEGLLPSSVAMPASLKIVGVDGYVLCRQIDESRTLAQQTEDFGWNPRWGKMVMNSGIEHESFDCFAAVQTWKNGELTTSDGATVLVSCDPGFIPSFAMQTGCHT